MPRLTDDNGFITVPNNPISKVGIFPYLGREIGAPDPDRIYSVYRSEEELSDPETIESFKLVPFIDEHAMLGTHGMAAEQKGIQGVIGSDVYYEAPYLRGNLRIYSEATKSLIKNGKVELSPGYLCRYEFSEGIFDGKKYDAIQRSIRGNHLALVDEGRTGPDVAVQDQVGKFHITLDSKEVLAMPQTMEELMALIRQILDEEKKSVADAEADKGAAEEKPVVDGEEEEAFAARVVGEAEAAGESGDVVAAAEAVARSVEAAVEAVKTGEEGDATVDEDVAKESMDKMLKAVKQLTAMVKSQDAKLKSRPVIDSASVIADIEARDSLYKRVAPLVGNFDASPLSKSAKGVAAYACDKLGIKVEKGGEVIAINAYLTGVEKTKTTDSAAFKASAQVTDNTWE